ncbi:bola-like protein-domain-containing protein [Phycomyces nitens]|nr:bola-like protein-domain-containing protein [Phycomyces nitens]
MALAEKGPVARSIEAKITEALSPSLLEIVNESSKHAHHAPMKGNTNPETHFNLTIVSDAFVGQPLMKRHRAIYALLEHELQTGLHALVLKTKTNAEYEKDLAK